jgi:citronellol/citronellal dehydrogenase
MFSKDLFQEKIVLVTGGGSGIGYEIAKQFLECGATVYISSRKQARLDEAQASLSNFGICKAVVADIRQPEQIEALAETIKAQSGRLDILINNAGGQFPSPAEDISINGWQAVINNNLNGTFYMTQIMANHFFLPQKEGNVVTIVVNNFRGFPGMAHTGAARAGIQNFTMSLAIEWMSRGVRLNCVAPGIIQSSGLDNYPPELLKGISDKLPCKRLGTVAEVAYSTLFLASPMSSYTTGETIFVDGGQRLWGDIWDIL